MVLPIILTQTLTIKFPEFKSNSTSAKDKAYECYSRAQEPFDHLGKPKLSTVNQLIHLLIHMHINIYWSKFWVYFS